MILDKEIEVTIINHNFHHYKNLGYDVKCKQKIMVKPEELSAGSHYIVNCSCDECGNKTNIRYQDYLIVFNKNNKYVCQKCRDSNFLNYNTTKKDLMKKNRLSATKEKYGVDNVFQLEFVKDKMKETCLSKYGFEHYHQNEQVKEKEKQSRIKKGTQIPDDKLTDFELYRKKVRNYTHKYKKILYNNWNGLDFYDNENIIEYKKLHYNNDFYPHVDHKVSIFEGFKNKIDPSIIGNIDNLCITKRINNLSKNIYSIPKRLKIKENK